MIYVVTFAYFVIVSIFVRFSFFLYAEALLALGPPRTGPRRAASMVIYLAFSLAIVGPIFSGGIINQTMKDMVVEDDIYAVVYIALYILSLLPGIAYFRRRRMPGLKEIGYFK